MRDYTVTFETSCYERDWELLLTTGRLEEMIRRCNYDFDHRILYINNVKKPEKVIAHAKAAQDKGTLTSYVLVSDYEEELLRFFGLTKQSFGNQYYYSIQNLAGIYLCQTDWLMRFTTDAIMLTDYPWIDKAITIMRANDKVLEAGAACRGWEADNKTHAEYEDDEFYYGHVFSDQCYLLEVKNFRRPIYNEWHPAVGRNPYPEDDALYFEKRVQAYLRNHGYLTIAGKKAVYLHDERLRSIQAKRSSIADYVRNSTSKVTGSNLGRLRRIVSSSYDPIAAQELGGASGLSKVAAVFWYRYAKRLLEQDTSLFGVPTASDVPISVAIVAGDEDERCLPLAVAAVTENICHPIRKIIVVSSDRPEVSDFCSRAGCEFADLSRIAPLPSNIDYRVMGFDLSQHLRLELAKLAVDSLTETDHILVIDSDTVLLNPHIFVKDGRTVRLVSTAFHKPYARCCKKLFGRQQPYYMSFDTHYMLFERTALKALRSSLESQNSLPWYQTVLQSLDSNGNAAFSAQEIYGNFTLRTSDTITEYAYNLPLPTNQLEKFNAWKERIRARFKSITFLRWYHTFAGGGASDEPILSRYGIT